MLLRPQAVILCSLEPCEVSKKFPLSLRAMRGEQKVNIMWITGKNGGHRVWVREREKDDHRGYIVFWITVSAKQKFWLVTNLSTTKTSQSQRSPIFTAVFLRGAWQTDTFCKLHSSFQMETQVFKEPGLERNLDYILSQNSPSFCTIEISVHDNERTISNSLPGL